MSTSTPATPNQTSLREAVGQAREDITRSDSTSSTGVGDSNTGSPDSPADGSTSTAAPGSAEEFFENATAEEIAAVKADPVLSKLYNSMLRDYKGKTSAASERQRQIDEREAQMEAEREESKNARALFEAIREDPRSVIKALAERNGMNIAEAQAAVEEMDNELVQMFGDDAPAVKPLFDKAVEKRAKAVVDAAVGPIAEYLNGQAIEHERQSISSDLKAFQAEVKEAGEEVTPEVEKEMVRLTKLLDQSDDLSNQDYIRMLYKIASGGKTRAEVTREVSRRAAEAVRTKEPAEVVSGSATSGSGALDPKLSFRESLAVARQEVRRGR